MYVESSAAALRESAQHVCALRGERVGRRKDDGLRRILRVCQRVRASQRRSNEARRSDTTRPLSLTRAHHASPFRRPPTGASPHALPTMIRILRLLHDAYTHNMLTCCNPLLQRSTSCCNPLSAEPDLLFGERLGECDVGRGSPTHQVLSHAQRSALRATGTPAEHSSGSTTSQAARRTQSASCRQNGGLAADGEDEAIMPTGGRSSAY